MKKFYVVADRGRVRFFQSRNDDPLENSGPHLREISEESFNDIPESVSAVVTDQQGRFARGGGPSGRESGMSAGENHRLESEMERQHLSDLAGRIDAAVQESGRDQWTLVAPDSILGRIRKMLTPASLDTLTDTISADLSKLPLKDLEERLLGKP